MIFSWYERCGLRVTMWSPLVKVNSALLIGICYSALQDDRILLTEDKDFGWLVFAGRLDSPGVVLIRYPSSMRASLGDDVLGLVGNHGSKLIGNFVVLKPGSLRISPKLRSS